MDASVAAFGRFGARCAYRDVDADRARRSIPVAIDRYSAPPGSACRVVVVDCINVPRLKSGARVPVGT